VRGDTPRGATMRFVSPIVSVLPLLLAAGLLAACDDSSDDTSPPATPSDEAGADSPAADAVAERDDASNDDAPTDDAATDGATPDAPPPVEAGPLPYYAILVGSDFATAAQATLVDVTTSTVIGRINSDDQDTLPYASNNNGFLLHRTQGKVSVLEGEQPSAVARTLDVNPSPDAGKANPYGVVVSTGSEAYVLRYGQNTVPVIDLATGSEVASVDLSPFVADPDGLVDVVDGVYGDTGGDKHYVYLVLQRIDQNEFGGPPDYVGACSGVPALVVGIDTQTHSIVDLNGAEDGQGIELNVVNPNAIAWHAVNGIIYVMGVGCAEGNARVGRGVEEVQTAWTPIQNSWRWESKELARPAAIHASAAGLLIGTDDESFTRHWRLLPYAGTEPGQDLVGVPLQPTNAHRSTTFIGLAPQGDGGTGFQIVSWDMDTKLTTVIAPEAFDKPGLQPYGSAFVYGNY